jgi:hypothetical protein
VSRLLQDDQFGGANAPRPLLSERDGKQNVIASYQDQRRAIEVDQAIRGLGRTDRPTLAINPLMEWHPLCRLPL